MPVRSSLLALAGAVSLATLSGCASLTSGHADETMTFTSSPSGADVTIVDVTGLEPGRKVMGETIFEGETPVTLELESQRADSGRQRAYHITIDKTGYAPYTTRLESVVTKPRPAPRRDHRDPTRHFLGWVLEDVETAEHTSMNYNQVDADLGEPTILR